MSQPELETIERLRRLLAASEQTAAISHSQALEMIAHLDGFKNWFVLAARGPTEGHKRRARALEVFLKERQLSRAATNVELTELLAAMAKAGDGATLQCLATIANPRELGSAVGNTDSKPTLGAPKSPPRIPRPVIILPPAEHFEVGRDASRPRGFPANPSMENLRRYLKKYQPRRYALTAFELIMRDLESKAPTISAPKGYNPVVPLNSRLADEIGRKKWRGDNPAGGYYPPWALLHSLSLFVDVTIDADDGDYGCMVIATRTEPAKTMVYEIKGPGFDTCSGL